MYVAQYVHLKLSMRLRKRRKIIGVMVTRKSCLRLGGREEKSEFISC